MIDERRARDYCYEDISLIENYAAAVADKTRTWDCHHRLEIQGPFVNSPELLERCGMYTNVPAWQLIFLPHGEHTALHNTGKKRSEETRAKMRKPKSAETRAKISAAHIGKTHSAETRAKMSEARRGKYLGWHWFNNDIENKFCKECPGEGWKRGRLKLSRI